MIMTTAVTHDVAIIGLGYVGLTLGASLADVGLRVLGLEVREEVVDALHAGRAPFHEHGLDAMLGQVLEKGRLEVRSDFVPGDCCEINIITVGTPLDEAGRVRVDMIENAARQVAAAMPEDALVILRSTVKIGTSRAVVELRDAPAVRGYGSVQ